MAPRFHQGLYRMAMAVDDVHEAWRALLEVGMAVQPTYTFAMPDTKITEGSRRHRRRVGRTPRAHFGSPA
jgi:hypothetical protein